MGPGWADEEIVGAIIIRISRCAKIF
jgi:hypothetical protein